MSLTIRVSFPDFYFGFAFSTSEPSLDSMKVAKDALELPPVQRLTLARILLDLTQEVGAFSPPVEAAWDEEICRRMKAVREGKARSRNFEQVFADLDRRFPDFRF